ncbi:MAG: zinc-binding alcohol dehydrogenase family protein [Lactobacillaceae bacterium]|jgi:NADPH2:quinone reductase|nr:zinc-binding alcohol dehydrogenase family protein [Lactobacillaceae bacterium]
MKAAVVRDFTQGPKYETDYEVPTPKQDEALINVTAAALSNRARSDADGSHYAAEGILPMIPGVDGVGTLANGKKVYFVGNGSFAETVAVEKGHWVTIPSGLDDVKIAGLMNPALSAWMALKYRAKFKRGQSVMILGATGNAGSMAVQIAKRMGAKDIIAVGRNTNKLAELTKLGATQTIALTDDADAVKTALGTAGTEIDIVLDYLWGDVAANAMWAIIPKRKEESQVLKWVEIGSTAGATAPIPGAAFRAVKLQLIGSGQGSVGVLAIIKSFKAILKAEKQMPFEFTTKAVGLSELEDAWHEKNPERLVFVPNK